MGALNPWRTKPVADHNTKQRLAYDERIRKLREKEYPMLKGTTYLDYAGTTLPSLSLIKTFSHQLQTTLLANTHSATPSIPNASQMVLDTARRKVLHLLNASPDDFEVIFVANATAGIKLVLEAFTGLETGFNYFYHRDCHTSLVGVRELALHSRCWHTDELINNSHLPQPSINVTTNTAIPTLLSYPLQSNMSGARHPLHWSHTLRQAPQTYTLLDIAAHISTTPVSLSPSSTAPDFTVLSFYKIFGFPDLGALVVRKQSAHLFSSRRYFGGGTTEMITCFEGPWVQKKERLCDRLEDGTVPIHSLLALNCAVETFEGLFGGLEEVGKHTRWLARDLYERLAALRHRNGIPVCCFYTGAGARYGDAVTQGPIVAFNVCRSDGSWVGSWEVGARAAEEGIRIRTGSLCNPAGMAESLGLSPSDIKRAFDSGFRCGQKWDVREGVPMGMVRVSLGAGSARKDGDKFVEFIGRVFGDGEGSGSVLTAIGGEGEKVCDKEKDMEVESGKRVRSRGCFSGIFGRWLRQEQSDGNRSL
ncbi:pyridoxal phosphate-dependent transferase [Dendryphion nanum]|uniref:Pyridoxal phosphate-dependent transferase n=1 Tax=Dendryphion nanum TaxID=256645 RepID=A0A9P9DBX9_9PLEO|nr:pyridoxal phosphate-dependent transferase [Dendryphion nanum]